MQNCDLDPVFLTPAGIYPLTSATNFHQKCNMWKWMITELSIEWIRAIFILVCFAIQFKQVISDNAINFLIKNFFSYASVFLSAKLGLIIPTLQSRLLTQWREHECWVGQTWVWTLASPFARQVTSALWKPVFLRLWNRHMAPTLKHCRGEWGRSRITPAQSRGSEESWQLPLSLWLLLTLK